MIYKLLRLIVCFLLLDIVSAKATECGDSIFLATFYKYRSHLLQTINNGDYEWVQQKLSRKGSSTEPDTYLLQAILEKPDKLCLDTLNVKRLALGMESVLFDQPNTYERFIKDTITGILLVKSFLLDEKGINEKYLNYCVELFHPNLIYTLADTIADCLSQSPNLNCSKARWILPLLAQYDKVPENMINCINKNDLFIKSMSGDTIAIDTLIDRFKKAEKYGIKKHYASLLGYIGTKKCASALLSEFHSDIRRQKNYPSNHYLQMKNKDTLVSYCISIRYNILLALGRIHYDNPLFTTEVAMLANESPYTYALLKAGKYPTDSVKRKIVAFGNTIPLTEDDKMAESRYIEKVLQWADSTYGIKIKMSPDEMYIKKICRREKYSR